MLKNFLFILSMLCVVSSCQTPSKPNTSASSFEKGKILLTDADKTRAEGDDRQARNIYKKAVTELENAVKEDINQKGLARMLGQSQYRVRDFDNAIQWFKKAIKQDPKDAVSHQYLGYCYVNKSKIQEAEASFKTAFEIDKSGELKKQSIRELTDIGELSLSLGDNFSSQGNPSQGTEFKKLGMRILAMALVYSKNDMKLAKKIQEYATEMNDQILMDWISNVITAEENGTSTITIQQ